MEEDFKEIPNRELIEIYQKTKEFLTFLEKEQKNAEKMRDEK